MHFIFLLSAWHNYCFILSLAADARSDVRVNNGNYDVGNATMKLIDSSASALIVGPVYAPKHDSIYFIKRKCTTTQCTAYRYEIRRYDYAQKVLSTVHSVETGRDGTAAFNSRISAITYSSIDHKLYFVTDNSPSAKPNLLLHSFDLARTSLKTENKGQSICQNVILDSRGQHAAASCDMDWTMGHNNIAARCDGKIYIQQKRL